MDTSQPALSDHGALEFGEDTHHPKHRLTRRRGRIDALMVALKLDARFVSRASSRDCRR